MLEPGAEPQVIAGTNGSGKTNFSKRCRCSRPDKACGARRLLKSCALVVTAALRSPRARTRFMASPTSARGCSHLALGSDPAGLTPGMGGNSSAGSDPQGLTPVESAAASCASTAWRSRARACSPIISKSSG